MNDDTFPASSDVDGGAAFPSPGVVMPGGDWAAKQQGAYEGMTLRDYFAAHAPDVPDDFGWEDHETDCVQRIARWRFHYAAAMLKARP